MIDIRYALRGFARTPLFTVVAVLSLAFGIGANTAVFSLLDQVMLRLLPVHRPEDLVILHSSGPEYGTNFGLNAMSYPMYSDFSGHNQVFSSMFCRYPIPASLGFGGRTERVSAEVISGTYFPTLGLKPEMGRLLDPHDDMPHHPEYVAVLSYAFWQNRFGSEPKVLGRTIVVNGHNLTIVGVAEQGFDGVELGSPASLFVPVQLAPQLIPGGRNLLEDRRTRWVNAFGRLLPGVTAQQAQAALQPYFHSILQMELQEAALRKASPEFRQRFLRNSLELLPGSQGRSYLRLSLASPLWILMALTGTVLLLACANLANLMLARAASRSREVAIRLSVGAGRFQIVRMLLVESLLLSLFGAALGLLFAYGADRFLMSMYLGNDTDPMQISPVPDSRVLLFTLVVLLATTLLFGLAPAIQAGRSKLATTLKDEAGSVIGSGNVWLRKSLVVAQIALSLLLLIGAGLFSETLDNLRYVGPGFSTAHLVAFSTNPALNNYSVDRTKTFYLQLTEALQALPGVQHVGLAEVRVLSGDDWQSSMSVEGYQADPQHSPQPLVNKISPGYFATLGVPLLAGREFTLRDTNQLHRSLDPEESNGDKAIINEKFAQKYFRGRNPIGRHIGFGDDLGTKTDIEVVGVVRDIKYRNVRDEIPDQVFTPYLAARITRGMTTFVRTTQDPKTLLPAIREQVRRLDPNVPVYDMQTVDEQLNLSLRSERLMASLSGVFGSLATVLALIGLYGLIAFTVDRRKREIAIRLALGAEARTVLWMVMGEVLTLIAIGLAVALPLAFALGTFVRSQVFGVAPQDPVIMLAASFLLACAAGLAGFLPAWQASRIAPTHALRYE